MKISKKPFLIMAGTAAAIVVFSLVLGCAGGAKPVAREAGKAYELVILHTNDHHGRILPANGVGGLAERAAFVQSVRNENPQVLLLDAGDMNAGTALSNMFDAEPDFLAYNLIGYDAAVFGNHEFDGTLAKLENQIGITEFPFFSSNIMTNRNFHLGGFPYVVKDYDGFRVGIIGITTLRAHAIARPDTSLTFLPEIDTARRMVSRLRNTEKADIIIALTHMGDKRESDDHVISLDLAAAVAGIDIVIDGHSHSFYEQPERIGNTYVVSAKSWGDFVGKGRLTVIDGTLAGFDWEPVEIRGFEPNPQVAAFLAPYVEQAEERLSEVIGEAAARFDRSRDRGSTLGNLIGEASNWYIREVYGQDIDFTFINSGGIRDDLPAGPITRGQILTILPFNNTLFVASFSGSELLGLFDFIAGVPQGSGAFPQFSGEVHYTLNVPERRIENLTISGQPVDPDRIYRFGTNDFLFEGGDGYTILSQTREPFDTSLDLASVVMDFIKHRGTVSPQIDNRITIIGGSAP